MIAAALLIALTQMGCGKEPLMPTPALYAEMGHAMFDNVPQRHRTTTQEVFYATTRNPTGDVDDRSYGNGVRDTVRLGRAQVRFGDEGMTWDDLVAASVAADREQTVELHLDNCAEFGELQAGEKDSLQLPTGTTELNAGEQAFVDAINAQLAASTHKDITVYIHGFKVDFYNTCVVSAELHHYLAQNGVMSTFAWPCRKGVFFYWFDVKRARETGQQLAAYLDFLARHTNAERIHLLSYSAGAVLQAEALTLLRQQYSHLSDEQLRAQCRIGRIIFAASDLDLESFSETQFAQLYELTDNIVVMVSGEDSALALSGFMSSSARLGALPVNDLTREELERLMELDRLDVIDVTDVPGPREGERGFSGHGYWYANPIVSTDILASLRFQLPPDGRGLARMDDSPVWVFPEDYVQRVRAILEQMDESGALPRRE